jgi:hypothetical protein
MYISGCKPVAENRSVGRIQQDTDRNPWSMPYERRLSASYSLCSHSLLCRAGGISVVVHHIWRSRHNNPTEHTLHWNADSCTDNQEFSLVFWCWNGHCLFHRSHLGKKAVSVFQRSSFPLIIFLLFTSSGSTHSKSSLFSRHTETNHHLLPSSLPHPFAPLNIPLRYSSNYYIFASQESTSVEAVAQSVLPGWNVEDSKKKEQGLKC